MCGRFSQHATWQEYRNALEIITGRKPDAAPKSNLRPNYNVAPTHEIVAFTGHGIELLRWGLIPIWAKEKPKFSTFNAKSQGIEDKATWKGSLKKMRCIIPANSFYEWKREGKTKTPYSIGKKDGSLLFFAGLHAFNDKIDGEIRSFTIITTEPNDYMAKIHNRMPVILNEKQAGVWLDGDAYTDSQNNLLKPCPKSWLTALPVANEVGSVKNNKPELIEPVGKKLF